MKKYRMLLAGASFLLALIVLGYILIYRYNYDRSNKLESFEFTSFDNFQAKGGLSFEMIAVESWRDYEHHSDDLIGAQYDFVLHNKSKTDFDDWSVVITMSDDAYVDSSWNGEFCCEGNIIKFTAESDNTVHLKPGTDGTFGAVIYSDKLLEIKKVSLVGYKTYEMTDMIIYKILNVLFIFTVVALICIFALMFNYKKYIEQKKNDSQIIKQSMDMFIGFIDAKDSYTRGHSTRVAEYAAEIARRMKLSKDNVDKIYYITLMHDCGKIGVPDAVLKKPGKLTEEEYKQIKEHTVVGDDILKNFTAIEGIREGAHYHHERYDGKGYPEGLKGEKIPLFARIICVADAYDAMSSDRCYRQHFSKSRIITELKKNKGKQFDPELVDIMVGIIQDGTADSLKQKEVI